MDNISVLNSANAVKAASVWSQLLPNPSQGLVRLEIALPELGYVLTCQEQRCVKRILVQE